MLAHTFDDVVVQLKDIIDWAQSAPSRLGYFPALYRKMTLRVQAAIAGGAFDDNARMAHVGVVFANRYLAAFDHYRRGHSPTRAWALSFQAAQQRWPIVSQHLLLGMNAHINLDLGIAMARSVSREHLTQAQNDFNKINDILAALVDEVQEELTAIWPCYAVLDWLPDRHDEALINFSLQKARDQAWRVAERLISLPEMEQDSVIEGLDVAVATFGHVVLHPGLLLSAALKIVRCGERGTIPAIIDILK